MKVLYISHVREGHTGWANAAKAHMLALDSAGIEVISRSVRLTDKNLITHPKIQEFEDRNGTPDYVIQHLLPHHLEFCSAFKKNIAYYVQDTYQTPLFWLRKLRMMDEVWCPNENNVKSFLGKVVPHPVDITKYNKNYPTFQSVETNGTKIFYTIVDFMSRKNIEDLLTAFHITFNRNEPVSLVIKASKFGVSPEESRKMLCNMDETIKRNLKLYRDLDSYKKPLFITEKLSEDELMGLHEGCDVYIDTSHGEAFCLPMFDAYAIGNTIVTSDYHKTILPYFKDNNKVFTYETYSDNIVGYTDTFFEVGNAHDFWRIPKINDLSTTMRIAYAQSKSEYARDISEFSYQNIGKLMRGFLEENNA